MSASSALPGDTSTHSQGGGRKKKKKKSPFGKMDVETFFRCCLVVTGGSGAFQNGWHCCMVIGPQRLGGTVQVRVTIRWNSGEADPGIPLATVSACDRRCSFRPSLSVVPRSCWKLPKAASWQSLQVCFALFCVWSATRCNCGIDNNVLIISGNGHYWIVL